MLYKMPNILLISKCEIENNTLFLAKVPRKRPVTFYMNFE